MERTQRAIEVATTLESHAATHDWVGTDAYEGLNATRFVGPLRRRARGRQVIVQAVKRSPLDLRRILGIPPTRNAAAVAWGVSAYARNGFLDEEESARKLERTVARLRSMRLESFREPCWGYPFDFQSRVFFYPSSAPNTIATAFAGMALIDAYERAGDEELLDLACGAARFFLHHVPQTRAERGAYFGYLVADRSPVHNANTHVCALLARLAALTGDDRMQRAAEDGLEFTLAGQRPDGSWPYGERDNLAWVDGFHTGYVLDALRVCADAGFGDDVAAAWRRGLAYYREHLFLPDGTPKYYDHGTYPIDAQCVAQGIQTLAIAAPHVAGCREAAWKVFEFGVRRMRRPDGLFVFQRRRLWTNRLAHLRWVTAPLLLATTHLLAAERAAVRPVGAAVA
jgi:hypothetical protein